MNKSYALFIPLLGTLAAWGQAPSSQPVPKVSFSYEKVRNPDARQRNGLIIHVELQPGWHINSEAPLDSFLVPTTVEAKAEGIEFAAPAYPPAVKQHSDVMGGDLALFTGAFDISLPVKAQSKKGPAPRTRVTLNYQACNNSMCYPPKSVTVEQ